MTQGQRRSVLKEIAGRARHQGTASEPLLVGIDGVDGAGKTVFADELTDIL